MKSRVLICMSCLLFSGLSAQDSIMRGNFLPPENPVAITAVEVKSPIDIDGHLIEEAWAAAPVVKDFFRMEPRQGGKYNYETFVRILFDAKNIYFGVFCKDSTGGKSVRVQDLRRDFVYGENDVFYLQLDPQNLKRYCVSFQATPYGNQRDLQAFDDTFRDTDWDALWKVRTSITDSGYYAEFAIPFASLRYERSTKDSASWGITMARLARKDYELTVFPAIPQAFSPYRMTYAAKLNGLKLPAPSINLRLQPYALYQVNTNKLNNTTQSSAKLGGEIKWAMTPHSVLDVTFNTDFAQADVDRAVNNLTRFNVLFPERRQFFLENSGIYAGADVSGIKPFFSRNIGLENAQFNANPVPLDAGIRFTDRTASRTVAGLYVHQQETDLQGAANFGVFRYLKNYGKQNFAGVMLTHRLDEANVDKGFRERNNTTLTIDGLVRPRNDVTVKYMLSSSRDNTGDSIGFAGSFNASWTPNKAYAFADIKFVDRRYVPGMGFIFQSDVIHYNTGGYYIVRPKGKLGKLIRRFDPGVFFDYYQGARDLKLQSTNLYVFPVWLIFQSGAFLSYSFFPTWEQYFFSPLGIAVTPGRYYFTRHEIAYNTDQSKKVSAGATYKFGKYYDGTLETILASGRLAPIPNIAFTANYEINKIRGLGPSQTNRDVALWSIGTRLALNPRIQLSGFFQYNTLDKQTRWNMRGSWEVAPLSFLYLVFNENSFQGVPGGNRSVISKLSYLRQF